MSKVHYEYNKWQIKSTNGQQNKHMSFIYYMYVCKHAGSLVVARPNAVRAIDAARTQPQPPNQ